MGQFAGRPTSVAKVGRSDNRRPIVQLASRSCALTSGVRRGMVRATERTACVATAISGFVVYVFRSPVIDEPQ